MIPVLKDLLYGDIIDKTRANMEEAHKKELARREKEQTKALFDKVAANQKAYEEERQRKLKEFMEEQDALDKLMKTKTSFPPLKPSPSNKPFKPFGK